MQDHPVVSGHYLYRFEVEGLYNLTGEIIKSGFFHIPETWITDNPESPDGVSAILKFYAIFEDRLEHPVVPSDLDVICFFTEDGLRKFRKHLRYCKEVLENRGYKWYRHRVPIVSEEMLPCIYKDKYQIVYERVPWRKCMVNWLISKGVEKAKDLKDWED